MGKRIFKELVADRRMILTGALLCLISVYALIVMQLSGHLKTACVMDAFANVSYLMPCTIYLIVTLLIVSLNRDNLCAERVVRQKEIQRVWTYSVVKAGILSVIFSIYILAVTLLIGRIQTPLFCIWNQTDSYYYMIIHSTIEDVNYGGIIFFYTISCMLGIFASSVMVLLLQWYFNNYIFGVILMILVNLIGQLRSYAYAARRSVFYSNIAEGLDVRFQILYPCAVLVLFYLIGYMKRNKDFLNKRGM
jgi:hypothetical protein